MKLINLKKESDFDLLNGYGLPQKWHLDQKAYANNLHVYLNSIWDLGREKSNNDYLMIFLFLIVYI